MTEQKKIYYIYMHENKINGKKYIGQTCKKSPKERWLNGGGYKNTYMGKAINKYGWDGFNHIILEKGLTKTEADQRENYYIELYNTRNSSFGYNIRGGGSHGSLSEITKKKIGDANRGHVLSEESRKKISEKLKGKKVSEKQLKRMSELWMGENNPNYGKHLSPETKAKLSKALKGKPGMVGEKNPMYGKTSSKKGKTYEEIYGEEKAKEMRKRMSDNALKGPDHPRYGIPLSPELKKKISEAHIGKKHTEETKKLLSKIHTGKKLSEEQKRKISERNTGRVFSEETRKKISMALLGKKRSEESKRKQSESNKGKKLSEEHKRKIGEGSKRAWAKIKELKKQLNLV